MEYPQPLNVGGPVVPAPVTALPPPVMAVAAPALPAGPDTAAAVLMACATRFREYAAHHEAKPSPDAEKVQRNRDMAALCDAAIAAAGPIYLPVARPEPPPRLPTVAVDRRLALAVVEGAEVVRDLAGILLLGIGNEQTPMRVGRATVVLRQIADRLDSIGQG